MPTVQANGITLNYDQQGSGEPLILIPYLSADHACYAFQVAEYAKHFTCISVDLRGSGESDKPDGEFSTELYADDIAALMQALGIARAHITGLSLGAAIGMWLAAKHPDKVKSLSLHSGWPKTDPYVKAVIEDWQVAAKAIGSVPEMVIKTMFPWCFTPELYATRYDYIQSLAEFVRSRPPLSVDGYIKQADAVIAHDVESGLAQITAPTQITFGRHDQITSLRFAEPLTSSIKNSELVVFEEASHAAIYECVEEFNQKTLDFLQRHSVAEKASGAI
ncbi:MAG TPA: alpha/beta hydrolase [Pyrinomonadaceae bacterium]|nr:alpha/beta hydrolase [Pyrinomonadaceae bacterium]